ncbi:MAG: hypothetical protein Q8L48_27915 [Archangium sp.]|nr:hypothetical protein [Archangium sp.]
MVTTLVVAVLAGLPSPQFTWHVSSSSGGAVLEQTALPDDACSLRCALQGQQVWVHATCLARGTDFVFVSEDCSTLVALNEYPLRADPTELTVAGAIATAKGPFTVRSVRLGELVDSRKLRGEGRRVRWLAGAVGEPGVKPHLNTAGTAIEFATTDGTHRTVRFTNPEDLHARAATAATAEPTGSDPNAMYQYVGEDGSTHFVTGLSQVPARFRKRATRVDSEVSSVKGEKMPQRWSPPSSGSSRSVMDGAPAQPAASKLTPDAPANNGCVFGLNGAACDAVNRAQTRGDNGGLAPRSPSPWGR